MAGVPAFGSPPAYEDVEAWWDRRLEFEGTVSELDDKVKARAEAGVTFKPSEDPQLNDARDSFHSSVQRLQARINAELRR